MGHQRSLGVIRGHLRSLGVIRGHQRSLGLISSYQESLGVIGRHQGSLGVIRVHQGSLRVIRGHTISIPYPYHTDSQYIISYGQLRDNFLGIFYSGLFYGYLGGFVIEQYFMDINCILFFLLYFQYTLQCLLILILCAYQKSAAGHPGMIGSCSGF